MDIALLKDICKHRETITDLLILARLICEDGRRYNCFEFSYDSSLLTFSWNHKRSLTYVIDDYDSIPDAIDSILDTIYA